MKGGLKMKFFKLFLTFIISVFAFNLCAFAASGNLSVSSDKVYVGDSFNVTVNINSSAAWNVHTSVTGPASGCIINQADSTADAMDTNKTFSATCTATQTGTITISLSGDVTSAMDGNAVNLSGTKTVTVSEKPKPTPTPVPETPQNNTTPVPETPQNNTTPPSNSNNNHQTNPTPVEPPPVVEPSEEPEPPKNSDSSLQSLIVNDEEIVLNENQFDYELEVPYSVDVLLIEAEASDSLAHVTLPENVTLKVGENIIDIEVIAEDGSSETYCLFVTRLEDAPATIVQQEENTLTSDNNYENQGFKFMDILFVILGILFIAIILFLFRRKKKSSSQEILYSNPNPNLSQINNLGIQENTAMTPIETLNENLENEANHDISSQN